MKLRVTCMREITGLVSQGLDQVALLWFKYAYVKSGPI